MQFTFCPISEISEKDINRVQSLLSDSQREYILKISEKKRIQSLAVRALLMLMLEKYYPSVSVSDLSFCDGGKPFLKDSKLFISLTHSGDMVGCAISHRKVGIDIEKIRSVKEKTVSRVCSGEELEYISQNGAQSFFTLWTLKEAYIKAEGISFSQITECSFVKNGSIFNSNLKIETGKTGQYIWSVLEI